ncbi:carbohydrate-binding protein [Aeoliella sp. SH292]|uniref:carbohydrate-binding protein n=1 Tax=Aeoliella sp. SH292 TaxID=3454464 RepID=UPI003F9A7D6A
MAGRSRLCVELLEARYLLSTFYVDGIGGSDLQTTGSLVSPFATIQRAVTFAQPGDTVSIREGVYREQVELLRSGTAEAPITFEAYNGEEVLVTTTELLSGWTLHAGNVYKTTFGNAGKDRNWLTLFVDGELMSEAHWSDQGGNVNELNKDEWAKTEGDSLTTIRDNSLIGLPNDYWDGAFVHVQTANWQLETKRIASFDGSTGTITVASPFFYNPDPGTWYLIYDSLNALDAPGEWYYDAEADALYLYAPEGGDPDGYSVEAKVRDEGFDLNGHDYIQIKGIDFRSGDLAMQGSDHVLLQGAHVVAPDRGFGPEGSGGARALEVDGDNNIFRDNEFERVWTPTLNVSGADNQIINNYFHHIGYNNSNFAAVQLNTAATRTLISHNTITEVGRAALGGGGGLQTVIQYNDISEVGRISDDGGALYFGNNSLGNMIVRHNVIHDNSNPEAWGIYFDNLSSDVAVHHNITYNVTRGGLANLSNSFVLWFNNTHYGDSLGVTAFRNPNSPDIAAGSRFYNNIFANLDSELTGAGDPAVASNNFFNISTSNFVNAGARDFRLVGTSNAIDIGREIAGITDGFVGAAPDAGALEFGESMWEFGHNFANPPAPEYEWVAVPYSNRVLNPGFEVGLTHWSVTAGTLSTFPGNAWNYGSQGLALFGNNALELSAGGRIEQTISGLAPNTLYEVSAQARLARDLQLENYGMSSGSFSSGSHRNESYISGVDSGEWIRLDAVDFGAGSSLYDRIEIGKSQNSSLSIALRLGNPTSGQLLGTLIVPSGTEGWSMTHADVAAVTGIHDLYVVFLGSGGVNGKFDRLRLLDTNTSERVTLGVSNYDSLGSEASVDIGSAYWKGTSDRFTFVTGPHSTTATLYLEKGNGSFNGYVDFVALNGEVYLPSQATVLQLIVDPATGQTVLRNNTSSLISFDAYSITDTNGSLLPAEWLSLQKQQYDAGIWRETTPNASLIAELTTDSHTTLAPGQTIYLGRVADPALIESLTFDYYLSDTQSVTQGLVLLGDTGAPPLPGDFNSDGVVNLADYTVWRDQLGADVASFATADGNGDGRINASDYLIWKRQFGKSVPVVASTAKTPVADALTAAPITTDAITPDGARVRPGFHSEGIDRVASVGSIGQNSIRSSHSWPTADVDRASAFELRSAELVLFRTMPEVAISADLATLFGISEHHATGRTQLDQARDIAFEEWHQPFLQTFRRGGIQPRLS